MMLTTMPINTKDDESVFVPSEEASTTPDEIAQANQPPEELSDEELEAVAAGFRLAILKRMSRAARSGFGPAVTLVAAIKQIDIVSFAPVFC